MTKGRTDCNLGVLEWIVKWKQDVKLDFLLSRSLNINLKLLLKIRTYMQVIAYDRTVLTESNRSRIQV